MGSIDGRKLRIIVPCLQHHHVWQFVRENVGREACGMKESIWSCVEASTSRLGVATPDSFFDMKRVYLVHHLRPRKALALGVGR